MTAPTKENERRRVLVVDDSEDNRVLIKAFLADQPYLLTFAQNGREAVDLCTRYDFDLVLMDLQMPEMDGFEAVSHIRAIEKKKGHGPGPILAVSAHNDQPDEVARCLKSGFTDCLAKPFARAKLQTLVRDSLAKEPSATANKISAFPGVDKLLADLVPGYVESRRVEAAELPGLLEKGEWARLKDIGHRLKGNAKTYGFEELGRLGARLEEVALPKDAGATQDCIRLLQDYVKAIPVKS